MSVISRVAMNTGAYIVSKVSNAKPVQKLCNAFDKNFSSALAWTTVGSIVAKDGVGCAMYVYQSKHNKEIPEDRRRFVTATDLTNGVLMIVAQIALFLGMRKYSGPIFDKLFKKSFNNETVRNIISKIRAEQKAAGLDPTRKSELLKHIAKYKDDGKEVFKFVLELAASTILAKRVIVPFIAIPLASKLEKKMLADEQKKKGIAPESETKAANAEPTMTGKQEKVEKAQEGQKLDTGSTNLLAKYKN
jgi:hypothetical protein